MLCDHLGKTRRIADLERQLAEAQKKLARVQLVAENHVHQTSREYEYDEGMNRAGEAILDVLDE